MSDTLFLSLPASVEAEGLGVPNHFGSPLAEQRSLAEGNAVVSLSHRGIVTVSGPDRLTWLHSMTSQGLLGLEPGQSVETLLLDPQGRIEHVIRLVDDGERSWLLVDEGTSEALAAYLQRMRFAMRVEVNDVSDDFAAMLAFAGGSALPALRGLGLAVCEWVDPWSSVLPGGVQYAHTANSTHSANTSDLVNAVDLAASSGSAATSGSAYDANSSSVESPVQAIHPGAGWSAVQLVFPREHLAQVLALVSAGKISAAGLNSLEALEIRAWRPTQHAEVDERALPHEFDWLRTAVHLNKGCYRGQETVAKVHNLGHPPRRLALLHLDGSDGELPAAGSLVFMAGTAHDEQARPVGRITRSALHYDWGGIALALLKRSTPEDAALEVRLGSSGDDESTAGGELNAAETSAAGANSVGALAPGATSTLPAHAHPTVAASQEVIVPADAGKTREIPRLRRL